MLATLASSLTCSISLNVTVSTRTRGSSFGSGRINKQPSVIYLRRMCKQSSMRFRPGHSVQNFGTEWTLYLQERGLCTTVLELLAEGLSAHLNLFSPCVARYWQPMQCMVHTPVNSTSAHQSLVSDKIKYARIKMSIIKFSILYICSRYILEIRYSRYILEIIANFVLTMCNIFIYHRSQVDVRTGWRGLHCGLRWSTDRQTTSCAVQATDCCESSRLCRVSHNVPPCLR